MFRSFIYPLVFTVCVALLPGAFFAPRVLAASATEIEIEVDAALEEFVATVRAGKNYLKHAKGVLVLPNVVKAGFGIGGEYGEGALRINGKTAAYYSTASASIGLQLGAQSKTIILVFLQDAALKKFRASSGWEAGVDGSVALVKVGAGESIDSNTAREPIVGFVLVNKGLMYNLTIEGSKFSKLDK